MEARDPTPAARACVPGLRAGHGVLDRCIRPGGLSA